MWTLRSLSFEPESSRQRLVARFTGHGKTVIAVMDAEDFPDLLHGEHDPFFNSTRYSDLAFYLSILLEEHLLTRDPDDIRAGEMRIATPGT